MYYASTALNGPEGEKGGAGLGEGVSGEALQGEGVEGKALAGDQRSFDAGCGAYELDGGASRPQLSRHAQRGDGVSSRAAPRYQDSSLLEV